MEKITTEDKEMTVTDISGNAVKVMAKVVTTDHGVTDEDGNQKISVNVHIPSVKLGLTPGKIK